MTGEAWQRLLAGERICINESGLPPEPDGLFGISLLKADSNQRARVQDRAASLIKKRVCGMHAGVYDSAPRRFR
jgi:hypothetical protein